MKTKLRRLFAAITLLLVSTACSQGDVENLYSKYKAYFLYEKVLTADPLQKSLTGLGEYCTIQSDGRNIYFNSLTNSYSDPVTSSDLYKKWVWINGLIIGHSNNPDMITGEMSIYCYDLVCPNCYEDSNISRSLTLQEFGKVHCGRCQRTYNLNDNGSCEERGTKLFQYRVFYNGSNTLLVNN